MILKKINTLREFINRAHNCPFCGNELSIEITGKNIPSPNEDVGTKLTQAYIMMSYPRLPYKIMPAFERLVDYGTVISSGTENIEYNSHYNDNEVGFYVSNKGHEHLAFSISLDTNEVHGVMENVQTLIWHHELVILRKCNNKECLSKAFFAYQSTPIILERKANRISPLFMCLEMASIKMRSEKFSLVTPYVTTISNNREETYLIDSKDVIITLPRINLCSVPNGEYLIRKIKTCVIFS